MYDLHRLGWNSFQQLCLTIARETLGQTVQSFLDSNDAGRDGAFAGSWTAAQGQQISGKFVIQCKFSSRLGYCLTKSEIADELPKVQKLVAAGLCDVYVLMTNAGLSGSQETLIRAELLRAGVGSLPRGQTEAGLSIGLTRGQTLRSVLLPQAVTAMLPALVGQLVVILKDTALGYLILYQELLNKFQQIGSYKSNPVPALVVIAAIFVIINSAQPLLSEEDIQRLKDLNVALFYIAGTELAIEVAGTELSTNMAMIGSVAGITKCVSMEALDGALQERFGKKFVASGGTASLDEAIKKKFAKKEMLLAKNLATVKAAYEIASEWADKNKIVLRVGNPAVAA